MQCHKAANGYIGGVWKIIKVGQKEGDKKATHSTDTDISEHVISE